MTTELEKKLRPYHVWALGVGIVLVGEYMGWNFTVAKGGIIGALFAMLVAGLMYIVISICASELGSSTKLAGGPYDWVRLFVGPGAAAIVGLAVYMEYIALSAGDAIVVGQLLTAYVEWIDVKAVALLILAILTLINYRGAVTALTLNFFLTFVAAAAIVIFFLSSVTGIGVVNFNFENMFQGAMPYGLVGVFAALQFGPWFYLGIEGAAMCAEECKRPTRAVPLGQQAGMITLLLMAGMTLFICSGLIGVEELGASVYPLFEAAQNSGVGIIVLLLAVGTLFTCLASSNGCINDSSRSWLALSRDGFISDWFADVHPKYKSPYKAIIFTIPVSAGFAFSGYLDQVITFSIMSGLVCYVLIPFALIRFRKMYPTTNSTVRPFFGPLQPWISYLAIGIAILIMSTFFWAYWWNLIFALIFYIIAYFYFSYRYKRIKAERTKEFSWQDKLGWPDPEVSKGQRRFTTQTGGGNDE
jgi:Amino acid transporters